MPTHSHRQTARRRASALWIAGPALLVLACAASATARSAEADRIAEVLWLQPGQRVADVGAGRGEWTLALAERVGPQGHVWATEVDADDLGRVKRRVVEAGLEQVTTVLGSQSDTGLPAGCCDAILLRLVYHHFTDPPAMRASLMNALRPGGRIAVVDVPPQRHWRRLEGVPDRGGHGIEADDLVAEMTAAGFVLLARDDDWPAERDAYCLVFERPLAGGGR